MKIIRRFLRFTYLNILQLMASVFYVIYIPLNLAFKNFNYSSGFIMFLEISFDVF